MIFYVPKKVTVYNLVPVSHHGSPIVGKPLAHTDRREAIDDILYLRSFGLHYKLVVG